jgi:CheY-like chemotaxis protein
LILFVTPHLEDVKILKNSLEGYIIEPVADVEEAISKTRDLFPRAILVETDAGDLNPDRLPYALPVLKFSISRSTSPSEILHGHLVKPISRKTLINAIAELGADVHNILVLDDDPAMIRFVQQSFKANGSARIMSGYSLFGAHNGEEARQILERDPIEAILLDLELPDIHGWDWLAQMRANPEWANIPVIVITAEDRQEKKFVPGTSVLELDLHRPLSVNELGSVVRSVLENVLPQYPKENQSG